MLNELMYDQVPAIYELGVLSGGSQLKVSAHKKALEYLAHNIPWAENKMIEPLKEEYGLPTFIPPTEKAWGFGEILNEVADTRTNWRSWSFYLPRVYRRTLTKIDWSEANATAATLSLFFDSLSLVEDRTDDPKPQLLHVDLSTFDNHHGAPISAYIGREMVSWVISNGSISHIPEIEGWMRNAYEHMWVEKASPIDYQAGIDQIWLDLECPGNACGLETDRSDNFITERGYTLDPHNVDNTHQQLTLLVGLAGFYQEARREGF
jgi:hypothetical protein